MSIAAETTEKRLRRLLFLGGLIFSNARAVTSRPSGSLFRGRLGLAAKRRRGGKRQFAHDRLPWFKILTNVINFITYLHKAEVAHGVDTNTRLVGQLSSIAAAARPRVAAADSGSICNA